MEALPVELLEPILQYVSTSDDADSHQSAKSLMSLCLTSRWLCNAAQPLLYKSIQVNIDSSQPQALLSSLEAHPELAVRVKELSLRMATPGPTPWNVINRIRHFLEKAIPLLKSLVVLKSNHRLCTTRLIESILYKQGYGYSVSSPSDLQNLRTLELFAGDYVFKYNFILKLPQLQRVCLKNLEVADPSGEESTMPDHWGWSSQSIKELILHLDRRQSYGDNPALRWNSLRALACSMANLESLRIEQGGTLLNPWLLRALVWLFKPTHENLLRLEIQNGVSNGRPALAPRRIRDDADSQLEQIRVPELNFLSIDWTTLALFQPSVHLPEPQWHDVCPLEKLQCLRLRVVEFETWRIPATFSANVPQVVKTRFPSLKQVDLELELQEPANQELLQRYTEAFALTGIELRLQHHRVWG